MRNPFLSHVAGVDLDLHQTDVAEINADAFLKCQQLIANVRDGGSHAMLLLGDAGSGKTHLLGRVQRWLDERARLGELSVFVVIRMAGSATMLWRLIRERLADALLQKRDDGRRVIHAVIQRAPDEIAEADRNLGVILGHLVQGTLIADSGAWLRGQELPPPALAALGVAEASDDEDVEAASERIVRILCQQIAPVPIVLCLDQLESIQSHSGDQTGFFQFGRVISSLHDSARNLAIFSCLQNGLINDLTNGLPAQDADRLMRRRGALRPLAWDQACRLAAARLDSVPELQERRLKHPEPIWPLDAAALRKGVPADGLLVARKVIALCSDLFESWLRRDTPPISSKPPTLDQFLADDLQARVQPTAVDQSDRILRTGLPSLFRLRGARFDAAEARPAAVLEGVVRAGANARTAVSVCNHHTQGGGLAKRLARLESEWPADIPALVIFRDARKGVGGPKTVGRARLRALEGRGARLIAVEPEALAALNALNEILADARSGDLAFRGDTVPLSTVEGWLASHLPPPLDDLLDRLADPAADLGEASGLVSEIVDLLHDEKVIRMNDACERLERPAEEVEAAARSHPSLIGFAGGREPALYRVVSSTPDA